MQEKHQTAFMSYIELYTLQKNSRLNGDFPLKKLMSIMRQIIYPCRFVGPPWLASLIFRSICGRKLIQRIDVIILSVTFIEDCLGRLISSSSLKQPKLR